MSDHIPADAGFLCDKDAVLGVTTKGTPCCTYLPTMNSSLIVPFLLVPKTKEISFEGRDPVRSKIVIDNKIIEKVNFFNYLQNLISYEKGVDIDNKLNNYLNKTDIIIGVLDNRTL